MADTDTQQCVRDDQNVCQLCGQLENLAVCGSCKKAWYCSKNHQRLDWKKHKHSCQQLKQTHAKAKGHGNNNDNINNYNADVISEKNTNENNNITETVSTSNINADFVFSDNLVSLKESSTKVMSHISVDKKEDKNCVRESENEKLNLNMHSSDQAQAQCSPKKISQKKFMGSTKKDKTKSNLQQQRFYLDSTTQKLSFPPSVSDLSKSKPESKEKHNCDNSFPSLENRDQYLLILKARFNQVSKYVVKCLNQYGICVVDKFLGEETATEIFKEVKHLESMGLMNQGQLVNGLSSASKNKHIRGDMITWVDGSEARCENIHYLISCMDTVMLEGAKSLQNCVINERTKAMVACYPGQGSGYIRHVDNPNEDGRCVTCIYYLNKAWETKKDGGLLRIYPEGSDQVANIEPVSDRLLFFWSDRRNPHEVEKAIRDRYAITVWYYDADERARALQRLKEHSSQNFVTKKVPISRKS